VTGEFEKIGSISAKNIARWDGDHWKPVSSGIGSGMGEVGYVLEVFEDHLYIGGYFSNAGELTAGSLAKWNGKAFVSTPGFQEAIIRALKVYKSELFVGGDFDWWYNGVEFLTTLGGTQWFSTGYDRVYGNLDSGGTGYVWDMEVFQDVLYISGGTEFGRYTELVAFDGTQFKEFGRAFSLHPENVIYTLEVAEEGLYIGGAFHNAVGTEANGILKWDGNQWNILTEGVDGAVFSLQSFQNQLYIGGNFDMAGGQPAGNIAAWTE